MEGCSRCGGDESNTQCLPGYPDRRGRPAAAEQLNQSGSLEGMNEAVLLLAFFHSHHRPPSLDPPGCVLGLSIPTRVSVLLGSSCPAHCHPSSSSSSNTLMGEYTQPNQHLSHFLSVCVVLRSSESILTRTHPHLLISHPGCSLFIHSFTTTLATADTTSLLVVH